MKKYICCLLVLLLVVLPLAGCKDALLDMAEVPPAQHQREEASPDPQLDDWVHEIAGELMADNPHLSDLMDNFEDDPMAALDALLGAMVNEFAAISDIAYALTSEEMRAFETAFAVTAAQERYLAFGAFVLTRNRESVRVFALSRTRRSAERLLRDYWNITDREAALWQLERLAQANGQSPIADDIFNTFVRTGQLEPLDPVRLTLTGISNIPGLENLYENTRARAEGMSDEFEQLVDDAFEQLMMEARVPRLLQGRILELIRGQAYEQAFELFVAVMLAERVNRGLEAYVGARDMLINRFGFTEEELLSIETLAAWDYGRAAIIARYGVAAGYLEEDETWEYLRQAADSASRLYSCWREYTAAHILGQALAFGSTSHDFRPTLDFLLNHAESPFRHVPFDS